jgi:hypothetical protein
VLLERKLVEQALLRAIRSPIIAVFSAAEHQSNGITLGESVQRVFQQNRAQSGHTSRRTIAL